MNRFLFCVTQHNKNCVICFCTEILYNMSVKSLLKCLLCTRCAIVAQFGELTNYDDTYHSKVYISSANKNSWLVKNNYFPAFDLYTWNFLFWTNVAINGTVSLKWRHYGPKRDIFDYWETFSFLFIILLYSIKG